MVSVVRALSQNSDYTEVRLLGFSYDFGVTVIRHQNADAMVIFTARNTNIYEICEIHRATFSSFYNI